MANDTFGEWLLQQQGRDDAIGDLAREAERDPEWPRDARSRFVYLQHLEEKNAIEATITAFHEAWSEYVML